MDQYHSSITKDVEPKNKDEKKNKLKQHNGQFDDTFNSYNTIHTHKHNI